MTVMCAREVRLNLILSIATAVVGLAMRISGMVALKFHFPWFLPEYANATKGCGDAILLLGLIWLGLTAIKRAMASPGKTAR